VQIQGVIGRGAWINVPSTAAAPPHARPLLDALMKFGIVKELTEKPELKVPIQVLIGSKP
jgi:hypothetical protein